MNKDQIQEKLKAVKDPELDMDIVTLGLLRDISIDEDGKGVEITMTLTTPFCPFADELIADVENTLEKAGFDDVRVEISFEPPWEPPAELRKQLGI